MYKSISLLVLINVLFYSCNKNDNELQSVTPDLSDVGDVVDSVILCQNAEYTDWMLSEYVLSFPVGESYRVDLSQFKGSYPDPGQPDQFAVDFAMSIGSEIIVSRAGTVVHIEQSG